jgi:hypothetical protein
MTYTHSQMWGMPVQSLVVNVSKWLLFLFSAVMVIVMVMMV